MNLDKWKPAWQQIKVMNQFDTLSDSELLAIIEQETSDALGFPWKRMALYSLLYSLLLFCFQG